LNNLPVKSIKPNLDKPEPTRFLKLDNYYPDPNLPEMVEISIAVFYG